MQAKLILWSKHCVFLVGRDQTKLTRLHQRIACITYTNAAKDEIEARTDRSPVIYCETVHAFCWSLIVGFQKQLKCILPELDNWSQKIEEIDGLGDRRIDYSLGHRSIKSDIVSLHHDDVIILAIKMMNSIKFRCIISEKFPLILIDEYQDTNADWIESIKTHFLSEEIAPQFGFFGDHWQKIYGTGCGKIEHSSLTVINKGANFRSVTAIVECLNKMRPDLCQVVRNPDEVGVVSVFHTNEWKGVRLTGNHWAGDLPPEVSHAAIEAVKAQLVQNSWDLSPSQN